MVNSVEAVYTNAYSDSLPDQSKLNSIKNKEEEKITLTAEFYLINNFDKFIETRIVVNQFTEQDILKEIVEIVDKRRGS